MITYYDTHNFEDEANLNITTVTSLKNNEYLFNVKMDIHDIYNNSPQKIFESSFSYKLTEKIIFNGSAELAIYQRLISEIARFASDAVFHDKVAFNTQRFFDHFSSGIFNIDSIGREALTAFKLVSTEQYLFERDLEEPPPLCSSVREFAIKYNLVSESHGNLLSDVEKLSQVLGLNKSTVYKNYTETIPTSNSTRRIVTLTDALLSENKFDEVNRITTILNS
ncbi:hypothetical protein AB4291_22345 [Vibrio cyclitrophicus]